MPKFKLQWGIPGQVHHEEEIATHSVGDALECAERRALSLTYYRVERLDPLGEDEALALMSRACDIILQLPEDRRQKLIEVLSAKLQGRKDG